MWPFIHHHITTMCKNIGKTRFQVQKHHIILRATNNLEEVSNTRDGMTGKTMMFYVNDYLSSLILLGSHLCDTNGCLYYGHLVLEDFFTNLSRQRCNGVLLLVRPATSSSPPHIIKYTPCYHGLQHPKSNGDDLMYSCRKIDIMFENDISVQFFNK